MGYYKKPYILGASVFATLSFCMIALTSLDSDSAKIAAILFFFGHMGVVVVDLLCEGKYAEIMIRHPLTGPDCVTWVWGTYMVGKLISSSAVGPMSDNGLVREMFYICIPLAAQVMVTAIRFLFICFVFPSYI